MATQIKLRRDTAANWTSTNPVLALGEPGLEIDTRKIKYGDGTTAWTSLAYSAGDANFSGNYTDLSNKPTIPDAQIQSDWTQTDNTSKDYIKNKPTLFDGAYSSLTGTPTIPTDVSDLTDTTSLLGGGATNEITNTDGTSTYSVSVATTGVVTMTTGRGGIEFGAMPEIGGPEHLHIMRPAGQNGSTDLYFGDDYNYVKLPGLYGAGTQGVEIGSSFNEGAVSVWNFGTDGNITLPSNTSKINYANGTSILSGSGSASTGTIEFSNGNMTGSDGDIRMQVQNLTQTGYYSLTPGVDYSTAVWDGTGITFNDPVQNVYDAISALTSFSTIQVQVSGNWFTVTSSGSSTPGMPQAPTLYVNEPAVGGPLNIDIAELTIRQGTTSYAEISGNDFRVDVQDDIRMYSNDTFILVNKSTTDSIQIETSDGDYTWEFDASGNLTLPSGGDILNSTGTSVLFNGDYTNLTNKPTIPTDISNLTDTTNLLGAGGGIALTDLSVGADNPASGSGDFSYDNTTGIFTFTPPDLTGYVTGTPWTSAGYLTSTDLTQYISVSALKTLVADSTDFADFKTRIAAL